MAHTLATQADGRAAMFCVGGRDSAWHLLGQRTENCVTWEEAVKLAGLDWEVVKQQLFGSASGSRDSADVIEAWGMFRKDNGAFLGPVCSRFTPVQNKTVFTFMDSILEAANGAHYESAGALGNGERIWALARIPEMDFEIDNGDKHQAYLMVCQGHDGSMGVLCKITFVRVVCQNTMMAALEEGGKILKIKHTANAEMRMERAADAVRGIGKDVASIKTKLERMAAFKLTRESAESILNRVFPKTENKNQTRRENILADVLRVYEINDRGAFPSIKGTAYNLLNAVIEYTDHERSVRSGAKNYEEKTEGRAESALFGSGETLKQTATEVIYDIVSAGSVNSNLDAVIAATKF
jgi:phage/plasmid-like protein (TIGR03299 family)